MALFHFEDYPSPPPIPIPKKIKKQKAQLLPVESIEMVDFYLMCREYQGPAEPVNQMEFTSNGDGTFRRTSEDTPPPPPRPLPEFGARLEGQRPGETLEEAERRMAKEGKIWMSVIMAVVVSAFIAMIIGFTIKVLQQ